MPVAIPLYTTFRVRHGGERHVVHYNARVAREGVECIMPATMNRRLHLESLENRQLLTGVTQISGESVYDDGTCPNLDPEGQYSEYSDFDYALSLTKGNLRGCWYTVIEDVKYSPNEDAEPFVYQERGREVFIGELWDGDEMVGEGTFETTFKFTAKYADALFNEEIHGRCQHPLVNGTGTGVFENATGQVDFKDDVETGIFYYRGHIKPLNGGGPNHNAVDAAIAAGLADDDSQDALFPTRGHERRR